MANKKFSEFLAATTIDDDIELAGLQVGVNKRFTRALLLTDPNVTGAMTITTSESGSPSLDKAFLTQQYCSGTNAGPTSFNSFKIWADNVNAGNEGGIDYFIDGFLHEHYFGGSSARGGRTAVSSYLYLTDATSASNDNGNYVALAGIATALDTDGGSAPAYVGGRGAMFGLGAVGHLHAAATNFICVTAAEFNVAAEAGSSMAQKTIIQLSSRSDDRVKGSEADAIILSSNQHVDNPKWDYGILWNYRDDVDLFPFGSGSTVMATGPGTIGIGIDFSGTTVSTAAFKSPGFSVVGDGSILCLNFQATGQVLAGSTAAVGWDARSHMTSPADGNVLLYNNAHTGFSLLQFGGTTSSFPALKRSSSILEFKLADDSAYTSIAALNISATGAIIAGATAQFGWTGRSNIYSPADGNVVLYNNANSSFSLLQFGGSSSSFPALKRNGAGLQARLADDSGLATLEAYLGDIVFTGAGVSTGAAGFEIGGLRTGDGVAYLDLIGVIGADFNFRIVRAGGANGNVELLNTGTGQYLFAANGDYRITLSSTALAPYANDGVALGTTSLGFSDAHFASGAVVNFANGNYTLTHSSGVLTTSGRLDVADDVYIIGIAPGFRMIESDNANHYYNVIFDAGLLSARYDNTWPGALQADSLQRVGISVGFPQSRLEVGGDLSVASWTTSGAGVNLAALTLTDTSGSGTIGSRAAHSIGTPTLASSSAVTLTDAATLYISAPPTAGTNTTITNGWALWIDSGHARFDGVVKTLSTTVGSLPAASAALTGARAFVTDANSTTFGATAVGGGANAMPVVCNGSAWIIG